MDLYKLLKRGTARFVIVVDVGLAGHGYALSWYARHTDMQSMPTLWESEGMPPGNFGKLEIESEGIFSDCSPFNDLVDTGTQNILKM